MAEISASHSPLEDGQVASPAALHDAKESLVAGILDLQGNILQQFAHQAVTDLAGGNVNFLFASEGESLTEKVISP